ncbi:MAG: GNAT family N-acetyltransferase [Verrucomicrobiae bacterium]|nr:GNAT family N-acetyltransferase [Verrucomicrobiae bacterium]
MIISNPSSGIIIRRYQAADRARVRELCCQTGFLGQDIAPVFEDRELFADYLTRYYTDIEPESSFVLEQEGVIKGYLLGSHLPFRQQWFNFANNIKLFCRGMSHYPSYNKATRNFIGWILRNSWREVPAAPRKSAHFHFNILPEAQGLAHSTALMNAYLDYLRSKGVESVYGQVVTFETRRGARVFERYGFQVLERREITKYRKVYSEPVYLTTVLMKLAPPDAG